MIATGSLRKEYGEVHALDGVDLAVPAGAVYGLVGPNGAGKTTLLSILVGLRRPTSGSVRVEGRRIGYLPDGPRFDPWLTAREVIELSASLAGTTVGDPMPFLERVGLGDAADRRAGGLSRGMLQRLGLAAVAVLEPDVWILDEPAAALDPAGRREVLDLVARLRGRATVLFASHILDDVERVCDRVGILVGGTLRYQGSLAALLDDHAGAGWEVELRGDPGPVAERLRGETWVRTVRVDGSRLTVTATDLGEGERRLVPILAAASVPVVSLVPRRVTLEDVFLELTR